MNLHDPNLDPDDLDLEDEDEEEEGPRQWCQCPRCGSREWSRRIHGSYSETHWVRFDEDGNYLMDNYDNLDQEAHDDTGWECENGHHAPDEQNDFIRENV